MTTVLAKRCYDKIRTKGCQKCDRVVRRLSKRCQRGFIGPFVSYEELFPESCLNKMTTQTWLSLGLRWALQADVGSARFALGLPVFSDTNMLV